MAPAWNKLGDEYAESAAVIIADVDCTKEDNKDLCKKYGVQGYPTVKYFTAATSAQGDAYKGGRDYDALSKWAKENLGPVCGADNLDVCDEDQKKIIAEKSALSLTAVDAEIEAAVSELKQADVDLDELLKSLQSQYEAGKEKKDAVVAELSPKLALVRSVKRHMMKGSSSTTTALSDTSEVNNAQQQQQEL